MAYQNIRDTSRDMQWSKAVGHHGYTVNVSVIISEINVEE
jgi:hypothetical protein